MERGGVAGKILYMYRIAFIIILLFFASGAGPCDMILPEEEENGSDASVECARNDCANMLVVEVVRADNGVFLNGFYQFAIVLPDDVELSIECSLAYTEAGFDCSHGNVDVLNASLDQTGQVIWISLLDAPVSATVTVEYNALEIGRRVVTPAYQEMYLSTPECPPACLQAKEAMAVQSW